MSIFKFHFLFMGETYVGCLTQVNVYTELMDTDACVDRVDGNCEAGRPQVVRQQLLEFLSPVALHHSTSFLAAMAVVWRERRPPAMSTQPSYQSVVNLNSVLFIQTMSIVRMWWIENFVVTGND